jgi:DNA polymerase-3 subunit epsilon/ATP-dependent DNA helicase DinG
VLLGTRSFWEGIDVPGDALSCVVIARLPFDVPTDPVFAARSETFEEPFFEFALPRAVLRLRQGVGRLIRTAADRGVVVILDRRILSREYGQVFLDALPPMRRCISPVARTATTAQRFLSGAALAEVADIPDASAWYNGRGSASGSFGGGADDETEEWH